MSEPAAPDVVARTPAQRLFVTYTLFVLVDLVVLNLFVEYWDKVVIESFTLSLFTAVVLQALLKVTLAIEHRVGEWFAGHEGGAWRAGRFLSAWVILFASKFVILEAVDLLFGDEVKLGGLLPFIALVVAMVVAEKLMETIHDRLGSVQLVPRRPAA